MTDLKLLQNEEDDEFDLDQFMFDELVRRNQITPEQAEALKATYHAAEHN